MSRYASALIATLVVGVSSFGVGCTWPPRGSGPAAPEPQAAAEQPVGVVEQTAGTVDQVVSETITGAGAVVRPVTDTRLPRMTAPRVSAPIMQGPSLGGRGLLRR